MTNRRIPRFARNDTRLRFDSRHRQRGWIGLIVLLLALVVVAFIAKDALRQFGLASSAPVARKADGARRPTAGAPGESASSTVTPIERARDVEETIKRAAEERERRMP